MNKQTSNSNLVKETLSEYLNRRYFKKFEKIEHELSEEDYANTLRSFIRRTKKLVHKNQIVHKREIKKKDLLINCFKNRISRLEKEVERIAEEKFQALITNYELLQLIHDLKLEQEKLKEFSLKNSTKHVKPIINSQKLDEVMLQRINVLEKKIVELKKQRDWLSRSLMEKFNELSN